jgi:hypothetical protein
MARTLLKAGLSGFRFYQKHLILLFFQKRPKQILSPARLQLVGNQTAFLGTKESGGEFNHSPPSTADVESEYINPLTPNDV